MHREDMIREIERVEEALNKTKSPKLRNDYTKYLRKLRRELGYYDRSMRQWQMNRT